MAVLTLAGKPINWAKPPKPTTRVMWSKRTTGSKIVTGSFFAICALDRLDRLAVKRFGVGISCIQPAYNKGVPASAGSHDEDMVFDVWIEGVDGLTQQAFFRANGAGAYFRTPAQGFTYHIHLFILVHHEGVDPRDDYKMGGFTVGYLIDGGLSLYGYYMASSQVADYYEHKTALSGHAADPTWFPSDIPASVFDLDAYVANRLAEQKKDHPDLLTLLNSHGPLARLGVEGAALWTEWEGNMRKRATASVRDGSAALITSDTNKHGALPNFGVGLRRIGGKGIDLIGLRPVKSTTVKVLRRKCVPMSIDGHDGWGVKVRVTFPSGKSATFWLVQANIGRGTEAQVRAALKALHKGFGDKAVYGFDEVDEGDVSNEHRLISEEFPIAHFARAGWKELSPVLVGKMLDIAAVSVTVGCPGAAKITPARVIVGVSLTPPTK